MEKKPKRNGDWIETVVGSVCWFFLLSAFAATFFKHDYPWLDTYARWVFAIALGIPVVCILGVVLFSIGYGFHRMWQLYRECMETSKMGVLGQIVWGILFLVGTIVGLFFVRF